MKDSSGLRITTPQKMRFCSWIFQNFWDDNSRVHADTLEISSNSNFGLLNSRVHPSWGNSNRKRKPSSPSQERSKESIILLINRDDYWQRLQKSQFYSLQRRGEYYRIIYTSKMIEGLLNWTKPSPYKTYTSYRQAVCVIPPTSTSTTNKLQRIHEGGFYVNVNGPKLFKFNALPSDFRNLTCVTGLQK